MRRFLLWIFLLLLVLVVGIALAVHLVLRSDLPRQIAQQQIQQRTGLEVSIGELSIGWAGRTQIRDLELSLPLHDQPFLQLDSLDARHSALPSIILTRSVDLHHAEIDQLAVQLIEDERGQWNLQRALETVQRHLPPPDPQRPTRPLDLPAIELTNASLAIQRHNQPHHTITDITASAQPTSQLGYQLDQLDIPGVGSVTGHLALAQPLRHRFDFDIQLHPDVSMALAGQTFDERWAGTWRGQTRNDGLSGNLVLSHGSINDLNLTGGIAVRVLADDQGPRIALQPRALAVQGPAGPLEEPLRLVGGSITLQGLDLHLQRVIATGLGGWATLSGQINLHELTGDLAVDWRDLTLPDDLAHRGKLNLTLHRDGPDLHVLRADIQTSAHSDDIQWEGNLLLMAEGENLDDLHGSLRSHGPGFNIQIRDNAYGIDDLLARFTLRDQLLDIHSLAFSDRYSLTRIAGSVAYRIDQQAWSAELVGHDLRLPVPGPEIDQLSLDLAGDHQALRINQLALDVLDLQAQARGSLAFDNDLDQPLTLDVDVIHAPIALGPELDPALTIARLQGNLAITGNLQPLDLHATGQLLATDWLVTGKQPTDLTVHVGGSAYLDPLGRERLDFHAATDQWFGGQWRLAGDYHVPRGQARLLIQARDVDLTELDGVMGMRAQLDRGSADLNVHVNNLQPQRPGQSRITGDYTLNDLYRYPLAIDQLTGDLELIAGRLRLRDIHAQRHDGSLSAQLGLHLDDPSRIAFVADLHDWPIHLDDNDRLQTLIDASLDTQLNTQLPGGAGWANLGLRLAFDDQPLGDLELELDLNGRMLGIEIVQGQTLQGSIDGRSIVDLNSLINPGVALLRDSDLNLGWQNLELHQLRPVVSVLEPGLLEWIDPQTAAQRIAASETIERIEMVLSELEGATSGTVRLQRTDDRRAPGPLQFDLTMSNSEAAYMGLPIGNGHVRAYADLGPEGRESLDGARATLQQLHIELIGGELDLQGRLTQRAGQPYAFGLIALRDLDLEILTSTLNPDENPLIGKLSGELQLTAPLNDRNRLSGGGSLSITDSDLADVPLISALYDIQNIALIGRQPDGQGSARFRLEQGAVLFERFHYRNRGLTISLSGRADNLWATGDSPIEGMAILSYRPLPDMDFMEVANEAFAALQQDLTTARLRGTINDPGVSVEPLRGVRRTVRRILGRQHDRQDDQPAVAPADPDLDPPDSPEPLPPDQHVPNP